MADKTLAMKALDGKRMQYRVFRYPDGMRDAAEIAAYLKLPAGEVFKTLVILPPEGSKKPLLVMVPASGHLDVKKLAAALNTKKVKMATQREAEEITGLQVGGISALALLNKGFSVFLDESARSLDKICISGGKRGIQLQVQVSDLIELTHARMVAVASSDPDEI